MFAETSLASLHSLLGYEHKYLVAFVIFAFLLKALLLYVLFYPAIASINHHGQQYHEISLSNNKNQTTTDSKELHNLALIIPAYNEEKRLPIMLNQTISYLAKNHTLINNTINQNKQNGSSIFEVIIVDDGSTDNTCNVIKQYELNNSTVKLRLIQMKVNSGKGAAIRAGMLSSSSHYCLMLDADGATDINDFMKLLTPMMKQSSTKGVVVIGSRNHLLKDKETTIQRSLIRTVLMKSFHFFVRHLCSQTIKDTQCGFKLFDRYAMITLFSNLHLCRWAFDIELIVLAESLCCFDVHEIGVNWREVDGSKLEEQGKIGLALVSLGMLRDMICVNLCYKLGIWKLKN